MSLVNPPVRAPRRTVAALIGTELLLTFALATPLIATLGLKAGEIDPAGKESLLGLVTAVGALAAFLLNPLFGHLSDRTRSRFGRRRPWILAGLAGGVPAAVIMATATGGLQLMLGWLLAQAAYNAALAALSAVIADRVPPEQQATVSGLFGAAGFAGVTPGLVLVGVLPGNLAALFLIPALAGVLGGLLAWRLLRDDAPVTEAAPVGLRSLLSSLVFDPRLSPSFTVVWVQRFLLQFANALIATFGLFYLMTRLELTTAQAAAVVSATGLVSLLLNVLAAGVSGKLASRTQAYRAFVVVAGLLMAGSMLVKMTAVSLWPIYLATGLAGIGLGVFYAVDLALVIRVMPGSADSARYLGVFNIAKALPQSIAPALAPLLLTLGSDPVAPATGKNYFLLFLTGAVAALAATALTPLIRT
ncbi:MFS transporter [Nonomuraea typhae]|uniref:MFS transporter n=1 Tax=Nonomuraea typhae TaxID=2603600 RepID=UPI0012FC0A20|nr:MFS transporter [Nonomuraea typhae]